MDLKDIQSAITDVERQLKRLRNKIEHREKQAAEAQAQTAKMKREESDLVDRYVNLVAEEQKIVRPDSEDDE